MNFRAFSLILLGSTLLAGCVHPDMTGWTEQEKATYWAREEAAAQQLRAMGEQSSAEMAQRTRAIMSQAAQTPVPQIGPYGQQSDTAIVYCRDLTGAIIACRQIR